MIFKDKIHSDFYILRQQLEKCQELPHNFQHYVYFLCNNTDWAYIE